MEAVTGAKKDVFSIGRGRAEVPMDSLTVSVDIKPPNQRIKIVDGKETRHGYFSYSSLRAYSVCHKYYYWMYLSGLKFERFAPKMILGSALHSAFELLVEGKKQNKVVTLAEAHTTMSDYLDTNVKDYEAQMAQALADGNELPPIEWGDRISSQAEYARLGRDMLTLFFNTSLKTVDPIEVEKLFIYNFPFKNLPGTMPFTGFIDLIETYMGEPMITDHKTGRERSQEEVDVNDQLTLYSFAEKTPAVSFESYSIGSTGGKTPARARPPKILKIVGRRTIQDYERTHEDFESLLLSIKAGNFARTGKENPMVCGPKQCQYYSVCLGRNKSC